MADPPATASPQPDKCAASVSTAPQNPNPNPILSPQIPPSPTVPDLSPISSPQVDAAAAAAAGASKDLPPQMPSPTHAAGGFGGQDIRRADELPGRRRAGGSAAGAAPRGHAWAEAAGDAASAWQRGTLRSPVTDDGAVKPEGRSTRCAIQSATANSSRGAQSMGGVMGTSGMTNQVTRPDGTIPYGAQHRFARAQMRPQQQLPASSQDGHMLQISSPQQQQQWLKQMQSSTSTASPVSPRQLQQEQRMLLIRQLEQRGLSQHQIAQALQQLPHRNAQDLIQQQQQHSSRMLASASRNPTNSTGSQPGTPLSGGTISGGSASRGAGGSNRLVGKRKIQDLVAQADPLGKVDPEVEDLILEIADNFVSSVIASACRLAKHRKSSVLEAKDVLLHLQRNWHISVPGFSNERM